MPILTIKEGARYAIYAWGGEDSCELLQFLENLERESNSDATRIEIGRASCRERV